MRRFAGGLCLGVLAVAVLAAFPALGQLAQGPSYGSTASSTTWTNPSGALSPEGVCASLAPDGTGHVDVTSFGFSIPMGATITGIQVRVKAGRLAGNAQTQLSVGLLKAGSPAGTAQQFALTLVTGCAATVWVVLGGSGALWGTTWAPGDVNAPGFGVRVARAGGPAGTRLVDAVEVTVYYTADTATITVTKTVVGTAPLEVWEFTGTAPIGSFTRPAAGGTGSFTVPAGTAYTITETTKAGYTTTYRVDGGQVQSGNSVTVTPTAGRTITIEFINTEEYCCVAFDGTLAFSAPDEETAEDPEALVPVSTQPLSFAVTTNIPSGCPFRLSFTQFERVGGTETLSTTMTYTIEGEPGVTIGVSPGYVDLTAKGNTSGTVYLTVTRSGYDDAAGPYAASVKIECLDACTPDDDCLCEDTRTVEFTIPDDCGLFSRGDLDFTDEKKTHVESPGHRGWVESGVLQFRLVTNHLPGVSLTVSGTAFEGTNCDAMLPTQARSTWQQAGAVDPVFDPLPAWGIVMPATIRQQTDVGPGYYYGQIQLRVERRGYNDPGGTYAASVTIVCSGF